MNLPPGYLFGLATALFWALADFFAKQSVEEAHPLHVTLAMQVSGAAALALAWAAAATLGLDLSWLGPPEDVPSPAWWAFAAFAIGCLAIVGVGCAYRAFSMAPLAVSSPLVNTKGFFAVLVALLVLGERAGPAVIAGAALCTGGAVAMSWKGRAKEAARFFQPGAGWAILAAFCYGAAVTLTKPPVAAIGIAIPVVATRLGAMSLLAPVVAWGWRRRGGLPRDCRRWRLALIGIFDGAGHICVLGGLAHADALVVGSLVALTPLITVVLALFFLKERLSRLQWAGLGAVAGGLVLLARA